MSRLNVKTRHFDENEGSFQVAIISEWRREWSTNTSNREAIHNVKQSDLGAAVRWKRDEKRQNKWMSWNENPITMYYFGFIYQFTIMLDLVLYHYNHHMAYPVVKIMEKGLVSLRSNLKYYELNVLRWP